MGKKTGGGLVKRGKTWHAVWMRDGERFSRSTRTQLKREAEKVLASIMAPFGAQDEIETLANIAEKIQGKQAERERHEAEQNPPLPLDRGWARYADATNRPDSGGATLQGYEGQFKAFTTWAAQRKPVLVPIHAVLAGMLAEEAEAERGDYVLPECAKSYLRDRTILSKRIQRLFKKCNIQTVKPRTGGEIRKRAVVEVGFHSLRHTFVSLCRESDVPLAVVESIVGHSNPAMTRHYTHTGELAAAAAVNGLPSVLHRVNPVYGPVHENPILMLAFQICMIKHLLQMELAGACSITLPPAAGGLVRCVML